MEEQHSGQNFFLPIIASPINMVKRCRFRQDLARRLLSLFPFSTRITTRQATYTNACGKRGDFSVPMCTTIRQS